MKTNRRSFRQVSLFVFFLILSSLVGNRTSPSQGQLPWGAKQGLEKIKKIISTLPQGGDRSDCEAAVKRMEEGFKKKTPTEGPRVIVDSGKAFKENDDLDVLGVTTVDDKKTRMRSPGWGRDEVTIINGYFFKKLGNALYSECKSATPYELYDFINTLIGLTLIHEAVHVDQKGLNDSSGEKKFECEAHIVSYNLSLEISFDDLCLQLIWKKIQEAGFRAVQKYC